MGKKRTETVILPAFLAGALVNGDVSGLDEKELHWLDKVAEYIKPGHIVSAGDELFFSHSCDLPGWRLGADMMEFTVLYDN